MMRIALTVILFAVYAVPAYAETVFARGKIANTALPVGEDWPSCSGPSGRDNAKNLGEKLLQGGIDAVGQAVNAVPGLSGVDPFNTRRSQNSSCVDLCVVVPTGANFTAKGSIVPLGWNEHDLPSGLPGRIAASWAGVEGPFVESTERGDVVCYTFYNWSHTTPRAIGVAVDYSR
jgi:hypothetical protein